MAVDPTGLWRAAALIGRIGLSAADLPVTATQALEVLAELDADAGWQLIQRNPVDGSEYPVAQLGRFGRSTTIPLYSVDARLTGRLVTDADLPAADEPGWSELLESLAGLVDWMWGPVWMTAGMDPEESSAIVSASGAVIPIPGRDPGAHLQTGGELPRLVAEEHPHPGRLFRFWWRDPDGGWHRVRVIAGPQGAIVVDTPERPLHELSGRELDVLTLVAQGMTNGQIASILGITEKTVAKHVERSLRKTASASRAVLAHRAVTHGLQLRPVPQPPSDWTRPPARARQEAPPAEPQP